MAKITSTEFLKGYKDSSENKGYRPPNDYGPASFAIQSQKEAQEADEYTRGYDEGKKDRGR